MHLIPASPQKKPTLLWDVGPSNMVLSPPQCIATGEKPIDEGNLITAQAAIHLASVVDEGASLDRSPRSIGYNAAASDNMEELADRKEGNTSNANDLCSPNNVQMNGIARAREEKVEKIGKQNLFLSLRTGEPGPNTACTEPLSREHNGAMIRLDIPVPSINSTGRRHEDLSLADEEESKNEMKRDDPTSVPPLEMEESSAENDLQLLIGKDKSVIPESSPSSRKTGLHSRKRKGKAFSDGDVNERVSKDEDDSHKSIESCNSARPAVLYSTGKKQRAFEQLQITVGTKRVKKKIHEGPASTSFVGHDSSFMNWIANMVKGLNKANQDEITPPSLALTLANSDDDEKIIKYSRSNDPGSVNMGFHNIFQPLYCSFPNKQETKMSIRNSPIGELNELVLANKVLGANITPVSCYGENGNSCKLACTSTKDGRNLSCSSMGKRKIDSEENNNFDPRREAKVIDNVGYRCDPLSSFWITRFSPKTPRPTLNIDSCNQNTSEESDVKSTNRLYPILPYPKSKDSDAMASVFARKLDALKHIMPSDVKTSITCFYCGKSGHNLRDCSEVTEIGRENLIRNASCHDGAEEPTCSCIRCFQFDHWAISCPKESKQIHSQLADEHNDGKNSRAEICKNIGSSSADNVLKERLITPLCKLVDMKSSDVPKGMFDAIRKLRLSRTNILKCMNSFTSLLHLDGFFLRVRLGKWEEGLGGTGYYVACITGEQREKQPQGSKKPISVNIAGIRCLVESQYISNQDFLEDELMAWWCATMRSGGKIPSEDHLKAKLQEIQRLGF